MPLQLGPLGEVRKDHIVVLPLIRFHSKIMAAPSQRPMEPHCTAHNALITHGYYPLIPSQNRLHLRQDMGRYFIQEEMLFVYVIRDESPILIFKELRHADARF